MEEERTRDTEERWEGGERKEEGEETEVGL